MAASLPGLFACADAPLHGVRVRTPPLHPDRGLVDVFVVERDGWCVVTDFGETLWGRRKHSVRTHRPPGLRRVVAGACTRLGVEVTRGQRVGRLNGTEPIAAVAGPSPYRTRRLAQREARHRRRALVPRYAGVPLRSGSPVSGPHRSRAGRRLRAPKSLRLPLRAICAVLNRCAVPATLTNAHIREGPSP